MAPFRTELREEGGVGRDRGGRKLGVCGRSRSHLLKDSNLWGRLGWSYTGSLDSLHRKWAKQYTEVHGYEPREESAKCPSPRLSWHSPLECNIVIIGMPAMVWWLQRHITAQRDESKWQPKSQHKRGIYSSVKSRKHTQEGEKKHKSRIRNGVVWRLGKTQGCSRELTAAAITGTRYAQGGNYRQLVQEEGVAPPKKSLRI